MRGRALTLATLHLKIQFCSMGTPYPVKLTDPGLCNPLVPENFCYMSIVSFP